MLFSHLATESIVSFSPQIDLDGDVHVSRDDMSPNVCERYCKRLLQSISEASVDRGVRIFIHRGVETADVRHTTKLMRCLAKRMSTAERESAALSANIHIVEHEDCAHHQIAVHLKQNDKLADVLFRNLMSEHR